MCCIGVILWSKLDHVARWPLYFQFFLFNIGTYSSRLWTALLAITLLFLQCRSLCFVLKLWPYMVSGGVPLNVSLFANIFCLSAAAGLCLGRARCPLWSADCLRLQVHAQREAESKFSIWECTGSHCCLYASHVLYRCVFSLALFVALNMMINQLFDALRQLEMPQGVASLQ